MVEVIACDIDLQRIHAWSSVSGRVCYKSPNLDVLQTYLAGLEEKPILLAEVASQVDYTDDSGNAGQAYNKRRWMLFNIAMAARLDSWWQRITGADLLVSPSSKWTMGYAEAYRHAAAKVTATNHDLREAEAMIFFYRGKPKNWVPFMTYLGDI